MDSLHINKDISDFAYKYSQELQLRHIPGWLHNPNIVTFLVSGKILPCTRPYSVCILFKKVLFTPKKLRKRN